MTWQTEDQFSLFDQDSWSGKMSPEHSVPTEEKTSKPSSKKSAASSAKKLPLFLFLKTDGRKADASAEWVTPAAPFPSLGDYTMHSFGESPNEENASRLSQILEDSPHPKYCLSARACEGILNRAERRGKELPKELKEALIAQSACKETESTEPTTPDATDEDGVGGGAIPSTPSTDQQYAISFQERAGRPGGAKESSCNMNTREPCPPSTTNRSFAVDCRNATESEINATLQGGQTTT